MSQKNQIILPRLNNSTLVALVVQVWRHRFLNASANPVYKQAYLIVIIMLKARFDLVPQKICGGPHRPKNI